MLINMLCTVEIPQGAQIGHINVVISVMMCLYNI